MKEKKTVASVVLGVALVSLITALVAGFAESLTLFIDPEELNVTYEEDYNYLIGGLTLGGALLGIAFVAVFLANQKNRFAVNLGLAIAVVAYCLVAIFATRFTVPFAEYRGGLSTREYTLYSSYLTTAITLMVSTALIFAAWAYLARLKKKEEPAKADPAPEEEIAPAEATAPEEADETKE